MSHIITTLQQEHWDDESKFVIYYYCYFGHNQDEAKPFLRWLLSQLCRQVDRVPGSLYKLYRESVEPRLDQLLEILEAVMKNVESVYIVVDVMDESIPRANLLRVIRDL